MKRFHKEIGKDVRIDVRMMSEFYILVLTNIHE